MANSEKKVSTELIKFATLLAIIGRNYRQPLYDLMRRDETFTTPVLIPAEQNVSPRTELKDWID